MENIIILILGVFISVVGIVNIKGTYVAQFLFITGESKGRRYTKVWKNSRHRNADYRNISCIRFYCFVLE